MAALLFHSFVLRNIDHKEARVAKHRIIESRVKKDAEAVSRSCPFWFRRLLCRGQLYRPERERPAWLEIVLWPVARFICAVVSAPS